MFMVNRRATFQSSWTKKPYQLLCAVKPLVRVILPSLGTPIRKAANSPPMGWLDETSVGPDVQSLLKTNLGAISLAASRRCW